MASEKPENGGAKATPQKFPLEKLAAGCRTLFGVSASTFAGATAGMSGDYSVAEMKDHINKWLKKEVKA
ncbi:hypothetical protein [Hominenteromicrobium sp.]|jgi:hypothetical protein|uniref:hypothetical protein n=1 Tax=Hominenteromicrobium sp. TaxID=3073581 RepID=UPI00204C48F9|nr:MAG TPA: hypothetical protein [Caudoviricetes sp.]